MSIYLTALVKSKPGHAAALKILLLDLVKGSRTEKACLQYELHQSSTDENQFIFHEEWADQQGLELHGKQEHIHLFAKASADLLDGPMVLHFTNKLA